MNISSGLGRRGEVVNVEDKLAEALIIQGKAKKVVGVASEPVKAPKAESQPKTEEV
jgi:hypothetical protein